MSLASRLGDRFKAEFSARLVGVLTSAILTIALTRLLKPDAYGLLFLAISVCTVGKLLGLFGLPKSSSRYIAEYKETDPGQLRHVLRTWFVYNVITIAAVSAVFLIAGEQIAGAIGTDGLGPFLTLGSLFVLFASLTTAVRFILQGFEDITAAAALSVLNKTTILAFAVGLVFLGRGAVGALTGYILSYAVVASVGLGYVYLSKYRGSPQSAVKPGLKRKIATYAVPITVTQSAHTIDHHLDKILVGFFIGPVAVAYYTLGKQVVQFIGTPVSALGFALSPAYGSQKAQGNADVAAQMYETALSKGLLLYLPAAAGVILLAEPGITLVFGADYAGAVPVLQILALFAVLQAIMKLTNHGLDYLGRARERAVVKITTAVLNVGLNVVLIPRIGVVGAAIATVVTFGIYTAVNVYVMHLELDLRGRWLLRQVSYALAVTGAMSIVVFYLGRFVTGFVSLFAVVCAGVVVWGVLIRYYGLVNTERLLKSLS